MKQQRLRTYPIKSLTIFLSICFVVSVAMIILFIFLKNEMMLIRVLIWIFCGLFAGASLIVLINQLFFYVSVDENYFYKHFIFGKERIPLNKIDKIVNREGFYDIYVRGSKFTSFASDTNQSRLIIMFLEEHKVKIEW